MDITLALGGGGARGIAHVGVLRVLEQNGFRVRAVAGTSFGSIVAALYASGRTPDEIEMLFTGVDVGRLLGWPLSDGPGLLGVSGIGDWLRDRLGDLTFADLKIPCTAVSVDINSKREIVMREGRVVEAILGSIAIPGIFPPQIVHDYHLIDGGTLDPVPVRAARLSAPSLPVVAVVLQMPLDVPSVPWALPVQVPAPLAQQVTRWRITQAFNIFLNSVDIVQRQLVELRLTLDQPDVIVRPAVGEINLFDQVDVGAVTTLGADAMTRALPQLRKAVALPARIKRSLKRSPIR
jgi:NTE family protein